MLFWITRTVTTRTLVEAPSRDAVEAYSNSNAYADYVEQTSGDTDDRISLRNPDSQRGTPDRTLDDAGNEVEEVEEVDLLSPEAYAQVPMLKPRLAGATGPPAYWTYAEYVQMAREEARRK